MAIDAAKTSRGALAGAAAAAAWAAQQPLDKRAFACGYDDIELLGKAITRGPAWPVLGTAMHVANGALFGAVYANVAGAAPGPGWARGAAAGLAEHFALWPLGRVSDRLHPARDELTPLSGNARALAQATWRHLLFGVVLGTLEAQLNAQTDPVPPTASSITPATVSSNGHGPRDEAIAAHPS